MSILNQFIPLTIAQMNCSPELKEAVQGFLKQLDMDMDDNGFVPGTEIVAAAAKIDQVLIDMDKVENVDDDEEDGNLDSAGVLDDDDEEEELRSRKDDDSD